MQAKKLFCAAAAFAILITMTACNSGVSQPNISGANDASVTSSEITEPLDVTFPSTSSEAATVPEITTFVTSSETNESVPQISVEKFDVPQSEALEFVKNLKIGWNLGNTFDATDCNWLSDEM